MLIGCSGVFIIEEGDSEVVLRADIEPMKRYEVTYTDDGDLTESSPFEDDAIAPVDVSISVGEAFINALPSSTVYVKHKDMYQYVGEAADGMVTFTTSHGFSMFEIAAADTAIAKVGSVGFFNLQDAVDELTESGTLVVTEVANGNLSAVVDREIVITVVNEGSAVVTLEAASGYEMTSEGNVYTFREADSESSGEGDTSVFQKTDRERVLKESAMSSYGQRVC